MVVTIRPQGVVTGKIISRYDIPGTNRMVTFSDIGKSMKAQQWDVLWNRCQRRYFHLVHNPMAPQYRVGRQEYVFGTRLDDEHEVYFVAMRVRKNRKYNGAWLVNSHARTRVSFHK